MKRPFLVTRLALVPALLVPAAALAAFSSGSYTGKTTGHLAVSFKVSQPPRSQLGKLSRLKIVVMFNCTDRDRFQTTLQAFPVQNIVKPRGVGRYNATFTGSRGASRYVNRGSILNKKATGTFTGRRLYNTEDQLDPSGTVVCTTGTLRYTARRP